MTVLTLRPNGDYATPWASFVGDGENTGTYTNVDEASLDTADGYMTIITEQANLHTFPDHTTESGTINSVKVYAYCWYSYAPNDAGVPHIHLCATSGTTGTAQNLTTSGAYYSQTWTTNPATSSAWSWTDIDNLVAGIYGISVRSGKDNSRARCAQLYVEVDYTAIVVPTVETHSPATSIDSSSAYVEGHATADGGASISDRGICYNKTGTPTTSDSHVHNGSGTGTFNTQLTGLDPSTAYHSRAFAINSAGTAYGNEVDFTTSASGWANIKTVNGVTATDLSKFKGAAVADIVKINGASV